MNVTINLKDCNNEEKVLSKIGEILFLGGIDGNIPGKSDVTMKGWGLNWDALNDSLSCLDTGGIWGNSPKFKFPLQLIFVNCSSLKKNDPSTFMVLKETLEATKNIYKENKKKLTYSLNK